MHSVTYLSVCLINVTHILRLSDLLEHDNFMYSIQKAVNNDVDKTFGNSIGIENCQIE